MPRLQATDKLGVLYAQADALNDLLHPVLERVCTACGGTFHRADVKGEARAQQKIMRTYGGDVRRVNDLVRASLVFDTVPQMRACLEALARREGNPLRLVRSPAKKMRLRTSFDAAAHSGGYRDVQLTVVLQSDEARARGLDRHLCEVQLHLKSIIALKSEGGHKTYVLRRNLKAQ